MFSSPLILAGTLIFAHSYMLQFLVTKPQERKKERKKEEKKKFAQQPYLRYCILDFKDLVRIL